MRQHHGHLSLVSFASRWLSDALIHTIHSFGYTVDLTRGSQWLKGAATAPRTPAVVLMEKEKYPRDKLISVISRQKALPWLGIYSCDTSDWDTELLGHFSEFIGWPCHEKELALRLERVQASAIHPTQLNEDGILEGFAGLNLIGRSPSFVSALKLIKKFAGCNAPVLVAGETGTGKELAARAIHYLSGRRDGPFIPVNCGAIPDSLVESELFGHRKGAFTDAKERLAGLIEQAQGGTLFLDEIDTLTHKGQVALLRFLQDGKYRPLGGSGYLAADARVIAATNSDLEELVKKKQFRKDLLYRLNIMSITMPPLRERPGDAELLAEFFLKQYQIIYAGDYKQYHASALAKLRNYHWPGNVRELENEIHRAYLLADDKHIDTILVNENVEASGTRSGYAKANGCYNESFAQAKANLIREFERDYLAWLMQETNGNVTRAAKMAGKERRALGKLLKKHGVK